MSAQHITQLQNKYFFVPENGKDTQPQNHKQIILIAH